MFDQNNFSQFNPPTENINTVLLAMQQLNATRSNPVSPSDIASQSNLPITDVYQVINSCLNNNIHRIVLSSAREEDTQKNYYL